MTTRSRTVVLASFLVIALCGGAIGQSPAPGPSDGGDAETALIKAILTKEIIRIVEGNISAAEREDGEIAKLVRALSGVSVKDIERYGICGGPNAEVRKLLGSVCNKIK